MWDPAMDMPKTWSSICNLLTAIFIHIIFSQALSTFTPATKPQKHSCGVGGGNSGLGCPQMKKSQWFLPSGWRRSKCASFPSHILYVAKLLNVSHSRGHQHCLSVTVRWGQCWYVSGRTLIFLVPRIPESPPTPMELCAASESLSLQCIAVTRASWREQSCLSSLATVCPS